MEKNGNQKKFSQQLMPPDQAETESGDKYCRDNK
jgi:hypothetical protein